MHGEEVLLEELLQEEVLLEELLLEEVLLEELLLEMVRPWPGRGLDMAWPLLRNTQRAVTFRAPHP